MNTGQLISGIVLSGFGVALVFVAIFSGFKGGNFVALIYGLPALVIGLIILFNTKEDKIEQVRKRQIRVPHRHIRHKGGRRK